MKKKILITGINGFLGSHLAKHLKTSFEVIGLEYSLDNLHRINSDIFKVYTTKITSLEIIFKENNFHSVIHAATIYRRKEDPIFNLLDTNINLPVRLLELCNIFSVNMFLNTDSFFNNTDYSYSYLSDYTLSKKQSLEWIKMLAIKTPCKVINMKVFHMYGENDAKTKFIPSIIDKIKKNTPTIDLTPGEQTRDFIYVKDVVSAFEYVINYYNNLSKYQEFEIGTGDSYSIKDLVIEIKKITNSSTFLNFGALEYRDGEIMKSHSENYKLKKTGWSPKYRLKEGLKNCIQIDYNKLLI